MNPATVTPKPPSPRNSIGCNDADGQRVLLAIAKANWAKTIGIRRSPACENLYG